MTQRNLIGAEEEDFKSTQIKIPVHAKTNQSQRIRIWHWSIGRNNVPTVYRDSSSRTTCTADSDKRRRYGNIPLPIRIYGSFPYPTQSGVQKGMEEDRRVLQQ